MSATLSLALGASETAAQYMSSPVSETRSVVSVPSISTVPLPGIDGLAGRQAYYTCKEMTWGAACAKIYGFGSYTPNLGQNGYDAPSFGTFTTLNSSAPNIVAITAYNPASVAASSFGITVQQLAGTVDTKTINSAVTPTATAWINGGGSFEVRITSQAGISRTYAFADGFSSGSFVSGFTIDDVKNAINADTANSKLQASIISDPDNTSSKILSVTGEPGNTSNFTVQVVDTSPNTPLIHTYRLSSG